MASPRSGPIVFVGLAVAIAAVDPAKLGASGWAQPALLGFASLAAVLSTLWVTGIPTLSGGALWLTAWLGWANVGAALSPEPGTSILAVGCFAAIGLASFALAATGSAFETVLVLGAAGTCSMAVALTSALLGGQDLIDGRLALLFLEPNQLARAAGLIAAAFGAVFATELLGGRNPKMLLVSGTATGLALVTLFLSQSRTGVAAVAVGAVLVLATLVLRKYSIAVVMFLALLLGIGSVAVLTDSVGDSVNQSLSRTTDKPTDELRTLNGRTVLWPQVVDVALERPVTGIGLGRDRTAVSKFRAEGRVAWDAEHAHSLPLHLWLVTGIPGLILLGGALTRIGLGSWRLPDSLERTMILGTLAVVLVDGIVEPTLRIPAFAWVVVTAAAGFVAAQRDRPTAIETTR